ncbi:hypothetical protein P171DRAFT_478952 [Karstenula rhodostoma CBS 690.94]|uniref:Uncharacterized protein n=1 Tax=Karstenula rhodostoma CBS 690.94 TaxID=1392251 RepID=A0A9P4PX93_9PLEO|nr:hypothetical protein P171DRAFT_478952 [Karstenula rhodostoma CBS 690.94]
MDSSTDPDRLYPKDEYSRKLEEIKKILFNLKLINGIKKDEHPFKIILARMTVEYNKKLDWISDLEGQVGKFEGQIVPGLQREISELERKVKELEAERENGQDSSDQHYAVRETTHKRNSTHDDDDYVDVPISPDREEFKHRPIDPSEIEGLFDSSTPRENATTHEEDSDDDETEVSPVRPSLGKHNTGRTKSSLHFITGVEDSDDEEDQGPVMWYRSGTNNKKRMRDFLDHGDGNHANGNEELDIFEAVPARDGDDEPTADAGLGLIGDTSPSGVVNDATLSALEDVPTKPSSSHSADAVASVDDDTWRKKIIDLEIKVDAHGKEMAEVLSQLATLKEQVFARNHPLGITTGKHEAIVHDVEAAADATLSVAEATIVSGKGSSTALDTIVLEDSAPSKDKATDGYPVAIDSDSDNGDNAIEGSNAFESRSISQGNSLIQAGIANNGDKLAPEGPIVTQELANENSISPAAASAKDYKTQTTPPKESVQAPKLEKGKGRAPEFAHLPPNQMMQLAQENAARSQANASEKTGIPQEYHGGTQDFTHGSDIRWAAKTSTHQDRCYETMENLGHCVKYYDGTCCRKKHMLKGQVDYIKSSIPPVMWNRKAEELDICMKHYDSSCCKQKHYEHDETNRIVDVVIKTSDRMREEARRMKKTMGR